MVAVDDRDAVIWLHRRAGFGLAAADVDAAAARGPAAELDRLLDPAERAARPPPTRGTTVSCRSTLKDKPSRLYAIATWLDLLVAVRAAARRAHRLAVARPLRQRVRQGQGRSADGRPGPPVPQRRAGCLPGAAAGRDDRPGDDAVPRPAHVHGRRAERELRPGGARAVHARRGQLRRGRRPGRGEGADRLGVGRPLDEPRFVARRHDDSPQHYLGRDGVHDLDTVVAAITAQPAMATFVATTVAGELLGTAPDDLVAGLADTFTSSGFDVRTLVRATLHAGLAGTTAPIVLGPVPWLVWARRVTGAALTGQMAKAQLALLRDAGQLPMYPPNVAGWPGGPAWFASASDRRPHQPGRARRPGDARRSGARPRRASRPTSARSPPRWACRAAASAPATSSALARRQPRRRPPDHRPRLPRDVRRHDRHVTAPSTRHRHEPQPPALPAPRRGDRRRRPRCVHVRAIGAAVRRRARRRRRPGRRPLPPSPRPRRPRVPATLLGGRRLVDRPAQRRQRRAEHRRPGRRRVPRRPTDARHRRRRPRRARAASPTSACIRRCSRWSPLWDAGQLADRPRHRLPGPEPLPLRVDGPLVAGRRRPRARLARPGARRPAGRARRAVRHGARRSDADPRRGHPPGRVGEHAAGFALPHASTPTRRGCSPPRRQDSAAGGRPARVRPGGGRGDRLRPGDDGQRRTMPATTTARAGRRSPAAWRWPPGCSPPTSARRSSWSVAGGFDTHSGQAETQQRLLADLATRDHRVLRRGRRRRARRAAGRRRASSAGGCRRTAAAAPITAPATCRSSPARA